MKFFDDPHILLQQTTLLKRFLEYVEIETTSDEHVDRCPSTETQLVLARKLVQELREIGLSDADLDENCYVTATLEGNGGTKTVGLIAHLDTAPAASGKDVKAQLHENYDGSPIRLADGVVIAPVDNPQLAECVGETVITADGTTLLGADDKAGIAVIMAALEYFGAHPDTPRPKIRVGFTPDEEIGRGALKFPVDRFGADVAFTLDGTFDGEINIETFNANSAFVSFIGVPTHPGTAKDKLVNALRYLGRFLDRLPRQHSPETTEGRQGFIHPYEVSGDASACKCHLILRDFDEDQLKVWGDKVRAIVEEVAAQEPRLKTEVEIKPSYPNMYKFLKDRPEIAERLKEAVRRSGIEPRLEPIRGGTDGANLTRMGLPCPNIFSGGMNFHGPTEWICIRSMGRALCTVLNLMALYADD
jgi:tripeptide aminopeptidase